MESEVVAETLTETIPSVLRDAAAKFGDAEAVADGDLRISFRELLERAEAVAAALVGSGVEPGDRVAMWAPNSGPWIIASFGVYLAGGVLVPLNTRYKGSEAAHVLRTAEVKLLLTVTDFLGADYVAMLDEAGARDALDEIVVLAGAARDGTVAWTDFLARGDGVDRAEVRRRADAVRPDDTSDIIFTSGTTGAPKGAMLGHGASVRTYRVWSELVGLARRRSLPRGLSLLPHCGAQVVGARVGAHGRHDHSGSRCSTSRPRWRRSPPSGSRCFRVRPPCSRPSSTIPSSAPTTSRRFASRSPAPRSCRCRSSSRCAAC